MPTTPRIPQLRLDFHPLRPVVVSFDAPHVSSDGGLLLLRPLDEQLGLCRRVADLLPDKRDPKRVSHTRLEQVRQVVFQIAQGYPDRNDADGLRHDPLWRTACDRLPHDDVGLSSQPTLSRLDHAPTARTVVTLQRTMERDYVTSLPDETTEVILDVDTTSDPTHGQQPFAFFHAHYGLSMYFPLLVFDGEGRLVSLRLRPGNAGNNRYAMPMLVRLVRLIKERFPKAMVIVRGDSGLSAPRLHEALDALDAELGDVDFLLGFEKNQALLRLVEPSLAVARQVCAETKQAARVFAEVRYAARSWCRERYIAAKLECLPGKDNPRFVVSSIEPMPARMLYENGYCARGTAENRIKDFKRALEADRLSCTTYVANAFRLLLHGVAYVLVDTLRRRVADVESHEPEESIAVESPESIETAPLPGGTGGPATVPPEQDCSEPPPCDATEREPLEGTLDVTGVDIASGESTSTKRDAMQAPAAAVGLRKRLLGNAQMDTLRLALLKVAAVVHQSVRRVWVQLPASFPRRTLFARVAQALGATVLGTPALQTP